MRRRVWFQVKDEQQFLKKKKDDFVFFFLTIYDKIQIQNNIFLGGDFKKKKYFFKKSAQ